MSFLPFISREKDSMDLDNSSFANLIGGSNTILLDVRTQAENFQARIPNSIVIDIHEPDFIQRIDGLERGTTYLVYCRSGARSRNACLLMKKMGFENVFNLKNGIIRWDGEIEND